MNRHKTSSTGIERQEEAAIVERRGIMISGALLLLSVAAFVLYASPVVSHRILSAFSGAFSVCVVSALLPRVLSFRRQAEGLLKIDTCGKSASRSRGVELGKAMAVAVGFVFLLVAPLVLTRFVDPPTWIALVTGVISGYAASNIFYAAYAIQWQRRTGIVLRRYRLWLIGPDEKRVLVETGIRRSDR